MKAGPDTSQFELPGDSLLPLEAVLCTQELNRRPSPPPDYETENRALLFLAQALADSPRTILQTLANKILEVFQADSAGISLLTKDDGGKRFYWPAIAGVWNPHIGGGTPRDFGPCGDVLDRNAPLLFRHFERRYTYFLPVTPPVEECLLVPFYVEGKAVGTIWAIAHDERRKFNAEDLRQLKSLSRFASAAYQAAEFLDALAQREDALRRSNIELRSEITERKRAAEVARQRTAQFETLLNQVPLGVYLVDSNFRIRQVNPTARLVFGQIPDLIGRNFDEVIHLLWTKEYADEMVRIFRYTLETGESYETTESTEYRIDRAATECYEWRVDRIPLPEGDYGVVCYLMDISARVLARAAITESEERLRQAAKLEAVGRLAGGVAHEVNNQMTVVLGCADFLMRRSDLPPTALPDLGQIRQAAEHSAAITQQLLAFGRQQLLRPEVVDLNTLLTDLVPVLRRTMGSDVTVELDLAPATCRIVADARQVRQILLNLSLNARDAISRAGALRIETSHVVVTEATSATKVLPELHPGAYCLLSVSDTGCGMDEETLGHIFEPFFSTKPVGKGTGLGLSSVYGIVKQLGADVAVESEPGRGTTFRLYFRRSELTPTEGKRAVAAEPPPSHSAMVLVAEDDDAVRAMICRALQEDGHRVLEATDGKEAIDLLARANAAIDLLVTDVAMPGVGGRRLAEYMARLRPGVPTLFVSGYSGAEMLAQGLLEDGMPFLNKPFRPDVLVMRVRRLLNVSVER